MGVSPCYLSVLGVWGLGSPWGTERIARRCGLRHAITIARPDQERQDVLGQVPGTDREGAVEGQDGGRGVPPAAPRFSPPSRRCPPPAPAGCPPRRSGAR